MLARGGEISRAECGGEELGRGRFLTVFGVANADDECVWAKFVDDLTTGATRGGGGLRRRVDRNRRDRAGSARYRAENRGALGAIAEAIGCVLDVASANNRSVIGKHRRAHPKFRIRRVGRFGGTTRGGFETANSGSGKWFHGVWRMALDA